jgi:hypothetical protein
MDPRGDDVDAVVCCYGQDSLPSSDLLDASCIAEHLVDGGDDDET